MTTPRKFRVWDGSEMHEPPHNFIRDGQGNLYCWEQVSGTNYEVVLVDDDDMDYTGLTDAEGAEVWEGDVLEDPTTDVRGVVRYHDEEATWIVDAGDGWDYLHAWALVGFHKVGDQHQHPELIEEVST